MPQGVRGAGHGAPGLEAPAVPVRLSSFSLFLFTYYAHLGTFATYASLFFAARGMSAPQVGVLMSLIQVMRIFGPNLWGWVADHTRRRVLVLRITAVAAIASFSGIFLGHDFAQFFAAMVLLNLFTSAQGPLTEALMLGAMKGDMSQYGRVRMWGSLGFIAAVMAAGYGLEWFGVEALPWMAGGLLVLVLAAALRIREAAPVVHHGVAPSVLHLLRQKAVIAFFAQAALMVAAHTSLYVFYSLYLERNGYSKPVIGMMWSLGVFAEVMFFYFQASVFRRVGAHTLMMAAFALAALRFVVIGAAAQWLAVLVLAQLLHCLSFAAHHSASIMIMQRWFAGPLQARGQALFMSIAYGIGGSLGGLFMSWCWEHFGSHAVYFAAAGLAVVGAGMAVLAKRWRED
jgi:PPP family 3-phenylpropionic acid transporter